MTVEVIEPHGLCAGVNAAIAKALKLRDVYCLHELVHNEIVIEDLKALGYRFVERIEDVPEGATVVFSAHGVSPAVRAAAEARRLKVVDTTCPFVAKVHKAARRFSEKGLPVVVIGDPKHVEVRGIAGEVEGNVRIWDYGNEKMGKCGNEEVWKWGNEEVGKWRNEEVWKWRNEEVGKWGNEEEGKCGNEEVGKWGNEEVGKWGNGEMGKCENEKVGVVSQTTMNADEVEAAVAELKKNYQVEAMAEVCTATRDRQNAVKRFCATCLTSSVSRPSASLASPVSRPSAVLVLGSRQSSNCRRLVEVAEQCGVKAFLAGSMDELERLDFSGIERLGVTSGASTPERFFDEAVKFLRHVPRHVAIIMDGNGRWATQRGKRRGEGHIAGARTLGDVLRWCGDRGIGYLTVYAFSTENWKRPKEEVEGLMSLFAKMLKAKERDFMKNKVRFRMIGRRGDLSAKLLSTIEALEAKTRHFERQFLVAISYGGRAEIVDAVNEAVKRGEPVTEETFRNYLYAPDVPDADLVIRTSGELRTSNFLLWESAYSEYYFTDVLWPDFTEAELDRALEAYAARHRRKGGVA